MGAVRTFDIVSDQHEQWLAERYWPGLTEDLAESTLDALRSACAELSATSALDLVDGRWMPEDEILSARFAGTRAGVVAAHEIAGASFDRLTRVIELDPRRR
jgi:hypothetical protein